MERITCQCGRETDDFYEHKHTRAGSRVTVRTVLCAECHEQALRREAREGWPEIQAGQVKTVY